MPALFNEISHTSGVSEEKVTCKLVFARVPESTEVAFIVIGDEGDVVDVCGPGFVKLIVCKLPIFTSV